MDVIDTFEVIHIGHKCLAAAHEPAPEAAAHMVIRGRDVLAGRCPQHRTAKDSARPAQLRLDGTIEHCDEALNTWSEDSHGPDLGPTRGGIGKALTSPHRMQAVSALLAETIAAKAVPKPAILATALRGCMEAAASSPKRNTRFNEPRLRKGKR
ncbi:MAG: hypothetical protein Q8M01_06375 [Rubrivivax sp.]|nr:hypothetical protein [Rubrivivax sp.]